MPLFIDLNYMGKIVRILLNMWTLKIENVKLSVTEKAAILFSGILIAIIGMAFGFMMMLLGLMALVLFLNIYFPAYCGCLIAFVLSAIMLAVIVRLRRVLIVDPVTRFMSKLLLTNTNENGNDEN